MDEDELVEHGMLVIGVVPVERRVMAMGSDTFVDGKTSGAANVIVIFSGVPGMQFMNLHQARESDCFVGVLEPFRGNAGVPVYCQLAFAFAVWISRYLVVGYCQLLSARSVESRFEIAGIRGGFSCVPFHL